MATKIILDCDPGHDDVYALWLAAGHPSLELLAVTTVGGNVRLEHTSRNARVALTVAGVRGVPVAAGASGPMERELETAESIHGENGLGGPELPEPAEPPDDAAPPPLPPVLLPPPPPPPALVAVLPPPVLVEPPTLPGLAVPPLIEVPALPMPLEPCRLLEPLCPVEP